MPSTEATIRDLLLNDVDMAAISTLMRIQFVRVVVIRREIDAEAIEAAVVRQAVVLHVISPGAINQAAAAIHAANDAREAEGCPIDWRKRPRGHTTKRFPVPSTPIALPLPREHGFEIFDE